jgi:hypothetical protein
MGNTRSAANKSTDGDSPRETIGKGDDVPNNKPL